MPVTKVEARCMLPRRYYSKFISAYKAQGIDMWGVTVQNEPEAAVGWEVIGAPRFQPTRLRAGIVLPPRLLSVLPTPFACAIALTSHVMHLACGRGGITLICRHTNVSWCFTFGSHAPRAGVSMDTAVHCRVREEPPGPGAARGAARCQDHRL
eukprot:6197025-Pleurochrysis_carterae.AAC.2